MVVNIDPQPSGARVCTEKEPDRSSTPTSTAAMVKHDQCLPNCSRFLIAKYDWLVLYVKPNS